MIFFKSIHQSRETNVLQLCDTTLSNFSIKHTRYHLRNLIEDHMEPNSLLAIKDIFYAYGIESLAIRKGHYSYSDFETPFVSVIQKEDWPDASFTIIIEATNDYIKYLDPINNQFKEISVEDFETMDKDIVLLIDDHSKKDEKNYSSNRNTERTTNFIKNTPLYLCILIIVMSIIFLAQQSLIYSFIGTGFLLSFFGGLVITTLLIWYEVDAYNPFLKEVCGGGGKVNCQAVLASSRSSFLGISWSVIGFAYMLTLFVLQIIFVGQIDQLFITSLISVIVVPYVVFSIYYQWKVVKQWCRLCLGVQLILIINTVFAIIFLLQDFSSVGYQINYKNLVALVFLGVFFLSISYICIPILQQANSSKNYERKWKKLRYSFGVFQLLLNKEESVSLSVDNLGIVIGNPTAKNEIIKVCGPYCGPCSKAHPQLEEIIKKNSDVKVRIIFKAVKDEDSFLNKPIYHFLAIEEKYGNKTVNNALDDWYLAESKDYDKFLADYPVNGEIKRQKEKVLAMNNWCDHMKIRATPTFFVNGKKIPESYSIEDLINIF